MSIIPMEKTKRKETILKRYVVMFGFGVVFTILMMVQGFLLEPILFYILEAVELIIVYFLIKSFVKRELRENAK